MDTFVEWGFAKDTNSEITTKNARKTADKANAMIDAGHVCPADYIFVVRIKYDSDRYETVWSHDYRGN